MGVARQGNHIVFTYDNMLGVDGNCDIMVMEDAFSGLKAAYTMPDKAADPTVHAITYFKGNRNIERFYSDLSGEMERALRSFALLLTTVSRVSHTTMQFLSV